MKPLILFDMDGTLIIQRERPAVMDYHPSFKSAKDQMKETAVRLGIPSEEVMALNRMAHIWNHARRYVEDHGYSDEQVKTLLDEISVPFMAEDRADHAVSVLLSDTITGLESLKKLGYEMGLVTTASRESYDKISRHAEFGCFGEYFKHTVTRDECNYIKPEPEPIYRILKQFGRDNFVYVGDTDHDAQACRAAGGRFVLINTRGYDKTTIESLRPDAVIDNLRQLPSALENLSQ
jgi:phosphoglycolate phosphatase-like HAD superfamily hydrolase